MADRLLKSVRLTGLRASLRKGVSETNAFSLDHE